MGENFVQIYVKESEKAGRILGETAWILDKYRNDATFCIKCCIPVLLYISDESKNTLALFWFFFIFSENLF